VRKFRRKSRTGIGMTTSGDISRSRRRDAPRPHFKEGKSRCKAVKRTSTFKKSSLRRDFSFFEEKGE